LPRAFCCLRAVKRCVNVGKNSEKVCDYELFRKSMLNFQASKCQGNYIKVKTEIPRLVRPNREKIFSKVILQFTIFGVLRFRHKCVKEA